MKRGASSRGKFWSRAFAGAAALACASLARAQEPAGAPALTPRDDSAPDADATPATTYPIHGAVRLRGRARWRGDERDGDTYATLELDAGDAEHGAWSWHVTAQGLWDVDGAEPPGSGFFSLADAQGGDARAYLYEAYGERRGGGTLERLRAGRQTEWRTPLFLWFDGASVRTRASGRAQLVFGAYGGLPVHPFESSARGDRVFGAWTELRPWSRASLRLDYVHLEDEERLADGENDLVQLALGQALGERLHVDASWSRLANEDRDARLNALWADAGSDTSVAFTFYRLIEPENTLALELDPLTSTLLELAPYWEARVLVTKGLGKRWRFDAGYDVRRLADGVEESTFNHELDRAFVTASVAKLPLELELSLTGEIWNGGADDFETWGADVTRRFGDHQRVSAGTTYALYKVDLFQQDERTDVRTTYLRWRVTRAEGLGFDLGYEYEDDPGEDLQVLRVGATWKF